MIESADDSLQALLDCVGWEYQEFSSGPVAHLLMHAVSDMASGLPHHGGACVARACARLVLRDGAIFAVEARAPRGAMLDVLLTGGAALAGQRYEEAGFHRLEAALAKALSDGGHGPARVTLERNATLVPRPVLSPHQIGRLAFRSLNTVLLASGQPALAQLPGGAAAAFTRACSRDDPAVQAYRAVLDGCALAYQRSAAAVHGVALDRLAVYNFLCASRGTCRNRVQAMEILPWLLPVLMAPEGEPGRREAAGILDAIDTGLPLYAAVARAFGTTREVVRWLGRRALPPGWKLEAGRLRRLLALLSWLPPERRPATPGEFEALATLGGVVASPLRFHGMHDDAALLAGYAPCMRRWLAEVARDGLLLSVAARDFPRLSLELADAGDFLRALFEAVRARDEPDPVAGMERVLRWCAGTPVRRLLALSGQWHAAVAAGPVAGVDAGKDSRWPAVLTQPWRHGESTIVELASAAQLRAEGLAMQHCVGSYATFCSTGSSMIVSVRGASGRPASTAELQLLDGSVPGVALTQHRAAHNGTPGTACVAAVAALLAFLRQECMHQPLRERLDFQRQHRDRRCASTGTGAFSSEAQQAAMQLAMG